MSERRSPRKRRCPKCGAVAGVPIVYGLPGREAFEAEQRGELVLGGCVIEEGAPTHQCVECGERWGREDREQPL